MTWVLRPPEKVISGESFDVIYSVFAADYFYKYAVENGIFSHRYTFSYNGFCECLYVFQQSFRIKILIVPILYTQNNENRTATIIY